MGSPKTAIGWMVWTAGIVRTRVSISFSYSRPPRGSRVTLPSSRSSACTMLLRRLLTGHGHSLATRPSARHTHVTLVMPRRGRMGASANPTSRSFVRSFISRRPKKQLHTTLPSPIPPPPLTHHYCHRHHHTGSLDHGRRRHERRFRSTELQGHRVQGCRCRRTKAAVRS